MKLSLSVLITFGALACESLKAQVVPLKIKGDTVTVQMQKTLGVGPDGMTSAGFGSRDRSIDAEEYKTYPIMKSIPAELTGVKEFFYPIDRFQFFFQSYKAGKLSHAGFLAKAKDFGWNLSDTTKLSVKHLKCYINAAVGKNKDGNNAVILDVDNNGDYADDKIMLLKNHHANEDEILAATVLVSTEHIQNGKIVKYSIPVCASGTHLSNSGLLSVMFPKFFYQRITFGGANYLLCASPGYIGKPFLVLLADRPYFNNVNRSKNVFENQYVKIGGADFLIVKIDKYAAQITLAGAEAGQFAVRPETRLKKQVITRTPAKALTSFSTGYMAPPIKGLNMNRYFTKYSDVSLAGLKGKFVFVDFWATYCGACVVEMPYLVKAYKKYPRDKFEIIGVFNETNAKITHKLMRDNQVLWPNILQHAKTSNVSGYGFINSYPTTLLINPEGKIVAKDLRGDELMMKLDELLSANVKD